jgi:hypothetical protein
MAEVATLTKYPYIVGTTTVQAYVILDQDREHAIVHNKHDVDNNAQVDMIMLALRYADDDAPTVVSTWAAGANKMPLQAGMAVVIPPGVKYLYYKAYDNDPSMTIIPGPPKLGDY